jgi:hypothetical protein
VYSVKIPRSYTHNLYIYISMLYPDTMLSKLILKCSCLILILLIIGCHSNTADFPAKYYLAISKRDTAYLKITKRENYFYGKYIVQYGNSAKDSGEIRGNILGDTLLGDYFYIPSSGAVKKRKPFALLQNGKTLRLGSGAVMSFMDIPYYAPEVAINYDSVKFVFNEIEQKDF